MKKAEASPQASDGDGPSVDELVASALADLQSVSSPRDGRDRLLRRVSVVPERYAPFFSRLSRMWELDEARVEVVLAESALRPWRQVWPKIRYLNVSAGAGLGAAQARLLRFEPGVRFPVHQHRGDEEVLVLEGSYTDSGGIVVGAGDQQLMRAGSEHALVVSPEQPCVAAIVQRGLSFGAPWIRRAKQLFWL